jgi:hypothetical protein
MSTKIEHVSAGGINFEPNKKLGYYTLGKEIYYNKNQALLSGSKISGDVNNLNNDPVRWYFNEDVFMKNTWDTEPVEDIRELYRQRAQQLRDSYDYIRLELSGGADSSSIVFAFLLNGIHLDEVIYRYPAQADKNMSGNAWDTSATNHLSEFEFAVKPLLNWIATKSPNTKITVHDYTNDLLELQGTDESWVFRSRNALQPGQWAKHTVASSAEQRNLVDRDIRIAMVFGCDKPKLCIKDGQWFIYFQDPFANHNCADMGDITNVTTELFYWSPDSCAMLAKQAHMVRSWFEMPQHHCFQSAVRWPNGDHYNRTTYESLVRAIVYPDYDFNTFQVAKPTTGIRAEMDHWFFQNFTDTKQYKIWEAGVDFMTNSLDARYVSRDINNQIRDIKQYISPMYYIGDSNIANTSAFTATSFKNDQTRYIHCIKGKLSIH